VITAAAVGIWLKLKRSAAGSVTVDGQDELAAGADLPRLPRVSIDDDEAAEIISRARPALDRAAKLL
jgi:hypothetical protein